MKYFDEETQTWKDVQIKVANAVKNEYGTSQSDCYSQNYLNDKVVNVGTEVDSRNRVNFLYSKNLYDYSKFATTTRNGITITNNNNGTFALTGTSTQAVAFTLGSFNAKANNTYYIGGGINGHIRLDLRDSSSNVLASSTGSWGSYTPTNDMVISVAIRFDSGTTPNTTIRPIVSLEQIDFEPYVETSIVVDNEEIYSKPVVLWQNPNPTSNFANQTITLASDNYDYFDLFYKQGTSSSMVMCSRVLKGYGTRVVLSSVNSSYAGGLVYQRTLTRTNDTTYALGDCSKQSGTTVDTDNTSLIPIQIIGYGKKSTSTSQNRVLSQNYNDGEIVSGQEE